MKETAQETKADPQNSQQLAQRRRPAQSKGATTATQLAVQISASPRVQSLAQLREQIQRSPRLLGQLQGSGGSEAEAPVQAKPKEEKLQAKPKEEKIQGKAKDELRQRRTADAASSAGANPEAATGSASGLPPQLKSGVESLSGMSMDHVQVHYNSAKPAQLNALAYAQGSDIHVGPGQEQHLPHEAWHVVQQAQGRVQATKQLKDGVAINDDKGLEHEADVKGREAMQAAGRGTSTSKSVRAALTSAALQRRSVLQGVFAGFGGGGWNLSNAALPGAMNVFPGGANKVGGGQQGGATTRTIDIASTNAYQAPKTLGGFKHFSVLYGPPILYQPGGKAKRYTHLHVINGKTYGPGTADNLTLGSTADNNQHRAQVEDHIRTGLPGANSATPYHAALIANPSNFIHNNVAYWNNPALPQVPGSQKAAAGAKVKVGGVYKPYTYSAQQAAPTKERRWAHYRVAPNYAGPLSPTIKTNMAAMYKNIHNFQTNLLLVNEVSTYKGKKKANATADVANAVNAMNAKVTAANLAGGVGATLTAGNVAANAHIVNTMPGAAATVTNYQNQMATERTNMLNFGLWALRAFPSALVCDANLYKASFDGANPWYKRSEPQTNIPINTN